LTRSVLFVFIVNLYYGLRFWVKKYRQNFSSFGDAKETDNIGPLHLHLINRILKENPLLVNKQFFIPFGMFLNYNQIVELPKRKPIRLPGYDYSQYGYYFITICTQNRECLFGSISVGADPCVRPPILPMMKLNNIGKMINKWLTKISERFVGSSLDIYQIMPNHIHLIIVIEIRKTGHHMGRSG